MSTTSVTTNGPVANNVPIKSAWTSKINWIATIGGALTAAAAIASQASQVAPMIPAPYGVWITTGAALITGFAVVWTRTFATTSVLSPSVK